MDKLKSVLEELGISIPELAAGIGVHERTAYKYVNEGRIPDAHVIPRLVRFLGGRISADDLYGLSREETAA